MPKRITADNQTTIPVSKDVRDRVKSAKSGGETYTQLLDRVFDRVEESNEQ